MSVIATIVLFVNVAAGVIVLAFWTHPERWQSDRRSVVLVSTHAVLAFAATAVWVVYLISRSAVLAWLGVGVLVATAAMGASAFLSSGARERSGRFEQTPDPVPLGALVVHGAGAVVAVILAVAAATQR